MNWRDSDLDEFIRESVVCSAPTPSDGDCRRARARLLMTAAQGSVPARSPRWWMATEWLRQQWAQLSQMNPAEVRYERARQNRAHLRYVQSYERRLMMFTFEPMRFTDFSVVL